MSDTSAFGFGKFVPGFDFLQNLSQTAVKASPAASAIPGMSSWVAPTLSVEELDKRIQELKAVQFWLEQNGTALKATIQALEVQKMTLTTLQGMNVNMAELAKAFTARPPEPAATTQAAAEPPAAPTKPQPEPQATKVPKAKREGKAASKPSNTGAAVDPMQWWGSLTQQFQNIAASAMQDVAAQAMKAQPSKTPANSPDVRSSTRKASQPATKKAPAKAVRKTAASSKARPSRP